MTKKDLIDAVSEQSGIAKNVTEQTLAAFFSTVTTSLAGGDKVSWPGFGTFDTTERAARDGRNPQTGKKMKIKARTSPKFKAAAALKVAVNGS